MEQEGTRVQQLAAISSVDLLLTRYSLTSEISRQLAV